MKPDRDLPKPLGDPLRGGVVSSTNNSSVNSSQTHHEPISLSSIAPIIAAIVVLLVITFLLVSYYRVLSAWFIRQFTSPNPTNNTSVEDTTNEEPEQPLFFVRSNALSGSLVRRLPVHKKRKGSVSLETCNDCAVCLGEFQDGEDVKILPNCKHGFHVECIDTWLSSHSNICPLCRAKVEPVTGNSASQVTPAGDPLTGEPRTGIARKRGSSMEEVSLFKSLRRHLQRSSSTSMSLREPLPDITVQLEGSESTSSTSSRMDTEGSRIHQAFVVVE